MDPARVLRILGILAAALLVAWLISRTSVIERHPAAFLFFLSYTVSALFWAEPEVIVDASRYFTAAKYLELYGVPYFVREWGRGIAAWTDMPAVPFLYGLIFRFLGETRLYIQIFTSLLFSGTVVLTYLTGRTLWDERLGMTGGLLLLGIPYLYSQVPLMLVDVPSMFFLTLSVYTFLRALERGGLMIATSALAIFAAFYSKYSTWLMLTVLVVILTVYILRGGSRRREYIYRLIAVGVLSAVMIGMVFLYKWDVFMEQIRLLVSYQRPGLRRWGESFLSTFFFQVHPVITMAAIYSIYRAYRKRDLKYLIVIWMPALIVLLQIRRSRYILMIFPMLALAASYGLMQLRDREKAKFIGLGIAAFAVVVALFAYLPFLEGISMANLKYAGEFLNSTGTKDMKVITMMPDEKVVNPAIVVPILDLYARGNICYQYGHENFPSRESIVTSPLRFTWEYRNPPYYLSGCSAAKDAIVVISDKTGADLPKEDVRWKRPYRDMSIFRTSENVFRFQTLVTVFHK